MNQENLTKQKFSGIVSNYFKQRRGYDKISQDFIGNQTLKIIFGLMTNISYAMFGFAFGSTILNGSFEKYKQYFQSKIGTSLLFFIAIFGILILVLLRQIKEDNDISAKAKKIYNCGADIIRTIFYILLLIFIYPVTLGSQDGEFWVQASFYIYAMAILLFIARKTLKWYYFLGEGSQILVPWENKNINHESGLQGIADFLDYLSKNSEISINTKNNLMKMVNGQNLSNALHQQINPVKKEEKDM